MIDFSLDIFSELRVFVVNQGCLVGVPTNGGHGKGEQCDPQPVALP